MFDIRLGVPSDVEFIMSLEREALALPWPEESVNNLLALSDGGNSFAFAAVCPEVGYIGVTGVLDEAEIGNLVVAPGWRGKGAGTALLTYVFDELKRRSVSVVFLEVESTNEPAMSLYLKSGFVEYGRRDDYYGAGRDAVLMKKELAG